MLAPLYASIEARWFCEGTCPDAVFAWFHATDTSPEEQRRIDRYLALPETDSLGAKLRGDDFVELKLRVAVLPALAIGDAEGRCERWHKWSLPVADPQADDLTLEPWVAVHKHRWTRHHRVTADGTPEPVTADAQPDEGCKFELTLLVADDSDWWSLAFESFGSEAHLIRNFDAVTHAILGAGSLPVKLDRGRSHGYPQWLREVRRR
jgi:hypothetical protein